MKCYFEIEQKKTRNANSYPLLLVRISHIIVLGKSEASTKRKSLRGNQNQERKRKEQPIEKKK